jgi:long-subunit fatty acid transport protein
MSVSARVAAVAALSLLLGAAAAPAQSPFARTSIGQDIRVSDARIEGRGGWGVAESDTLSPSFHNVAGLPGLRHVAISVCGFAALTASETSTSSRNTSRVTTPSVRLGLPLAGGRAVVTAGFRALRGTQYTTVTPLETLLPDPADPLGDPVIFHGTETLVREGTQFEVPLGGAYRVNDRLSFGATLNLVRGVVRERLRDDFGTPDGAGNSPYVAVSEVLTDDISGLSTTWSVQASPWRQLRLGASVTPGHGWDMTRTRDMLGLPGTRTQLYEVRLPATWSLGAQLPVRGRWRAGCEYESQPFGGFAGNNAWAAGMVDAWRWSVGVERTEEWRRHGGWRNLPLRLGVMRQRWPYRVGGSDVLETRIAAGTGLTFRDQSGHLDVALSYGWTGELPDNGLADRTWRLTVSLAGLERWW